MKPLSGDELTALRQILESTGPSGCLLYERIEELSFHIQTSVSLSFSQWALLNTNTGFAIGVLSGAEHKSIREQDVFAEACNYAIERLEDALDDLRTHSTFPFDETTSDDT